MSGKLVGEVIDAAIHLRDRGLSERGFHALVAIAEKCHPQTRQGTVRWDHIRAGLYGASLSTAKRAVKDLKTAGIVSVIKRGFDNHAGRSCAPVYGIAPLGQRVTQVNQSHTSERVSQVNQSPTEPTGHIGEPTGQIERRTGHPGDLLDGSIDGSIDGGARADAAAPTPPSSSSDEEPNPRCPKHTGMGWVEESCTNCQKARAKHKAWKAGYDDRRLIAESARIAAIDACAMCDECGFLDGVLDERGNDTVMECDHQGAA